jgi:hypothetical protein
MGDDGHILVGQDIENFGEVLIFCRSGKTQVRHTENIRAELSPPGWIFTRPILTINSFTRGFFGLAA